MQPVHCQEPFAECWWGPDGIDAHGIGDGIPYEFDGGGA